MTDDTVKRPQSRVKKPASESSLEKPAADIDALLIAVANHADRQAFSELFRQLSGKVYGSALKILHNDQLARDAVQEAMLSIWQKAPLFDADKGSAQSWIFTLVRNRCFDMLRRQQRQPACVSADDIWPLGELPAAADESAEDATDGLAQDEIRQHYNQLPTPQRDVVVQVFVQGKTHQETAQALNIPLGTVKSRLRLALAKLKQQIGKAS